MSFCVESVCATLHPFQKPLDPLCG
uniref:Uncharacterized protein n=1 Tax=Rhizophora mucronata TaxID=61149 RepID=A0A2P2QYH7_RHIMU